MPFFDYKCVGCDHIKELITQGEPTQKRWCDKCGTLREYQKQLSAPIGFILRGSGFYKPSASKEN